MKEFAKGMAMFIIKIVIEILIIDACVMLGTWIANKVVSAYQTIKSKITGKPIPQPQADEA